MTTDTSGPDSDTTGGVYVAVLDLSDMVASDVLRYRQYEAARSGDTQRIIFEAIFRDAQAVPNWESPPLMVKNGWDMTLYGITGTITVNWAIHKIA